MHADNVMQATKSAQQFASAFLEAFHASEEYSRNSIDQLARMATSSNEEDIAAATKALFASVIEHLADSFDPRAASVYNQLMAQLIQYCRGLEQSRDLDNELNKFGLRSENDLLARTEKLNQTQKRDWLYTTRNEMKRIVVLSRVTIGADVAVTSVIIERLKREFPDAEIALVGGGKVSEIFGGDPRLLFHTVNYRRAGATLDRLFNWLTVLDNVRNLTKQLSSKQYLIVDPDSRLTQLGLLPLANSELASEQLIQSNTAHNYLFFPSRSYGGNERKAISELASLWLSEVFGTSIVQLPRVNLAAKDIELAGEIVRRMRAGGARRIVAVNFGIGENPAKHLGNEFERLLVQGLMQSGTAVIFDKGFGEEEERRADDVIDRIRNTEGRGREIRVAEAGEDALHRLLAESNKLQTDILVWRGRIGLFAGLISHSDLYVGYDSAFQHIAAALGVVCIDIFAGFSSARMADRWRPTGANESRVLIVDTLNDNPNTDAILSDALAFANELCG